VGALGTPDIFNPKEYPPFGDGGRVRCDLFRVRALCMFDKSLQEYVLIVTYTPKWGDTHKVSALTGYAYAHDYYRNFTLLLT
jgi:hypothetical protein